MKVERDLCYLYILDCSFVSMLFGSKKNLNPSAVPSVFQGIYNILYNSWPWWFLNLIHMLSLCGRLQADTSRWQAKIWRRKLDGRKNFRGRRKQPSPCLRRLSNGTALLSRQPHYCPKHWTNGVSPSAIYIIALELSTSSWEKTHPSSWYFNHHIVEIDPTTLSRV